MSDTTKEPKPKLKTFNVGYCIEQGFSINVEATSADEAERIIEERLDEECDELEGSTRVHYEGFIACTSEVDP